MNTHLESALSAAFGATLSFLWVRTLILVGVKGSLWASTATVEHHGLY